VDKINGIRVIMGGLLAGAVIIVCEYIVNSVLLARRWATTMRALGKHPPTGPNEMTSFIIWGFLVGLFAIWLYAAIRPRYGAGPRTAIMAGVAVWVLAYLLGAIPAAALHIFSHHLIVYGILVGLVEAVAGTLLGAWIYKEDSAPAEADAAAAAAGE
jgi:uncharacterized membrane protein